jgi:hypothetical protein
LVSLLTKNTPKSPLGASIAVLVEEANIEKKKLYKI